MPYDPFDGLTEELRECAIRRLKKAQDRVVAEFTFKRKSLEERESQKLKAIKDNRQKWALEGSEPEDAYWSYRADVRSRRRLDSNQNQLDQKFYAIQAATKNRLAAPETIEITGEDMRVHAECLKRRAKHGERKHSGDALEAAVDRAYSKFNAALAEALDAAIIADETASIASDRYESTTHDDGQKSLVTATRHSAANSLNSLNSYKLEDWDLSNRTANCLRNESIFSIADLVRKNTQEMLRISNFGRKSLDEIEEILDSLGLSLGMKLPE